MVQSYTPDTLCYRGYISVTVASNLAFNSGNFFTLNMVRPNNNQVFADSVPATHGGTYNFPIPYGFNPGTLANFSVVSTSPAYTTQWAGDMVYLKTSPPPTSFAAEWTYCNGSSTLLLYSNASTAPYTNVWTSNPAGLQDTAAHISFTPTQNTTIYLYSLDTATGCSVTDTLHVSYANVPALNITDSIFAICSANNITLGGTTTANCAYVWTGSGLNSSAVNPVVSPVINSTYHVQLTDTTSGCKTSGNIQVTIDTPVAQKICLVTVDSSTSRNLLVWEKVDKFALDSFHIYREVSTNNYTIIASIPRDSLSEYEDSDANPAVASYRYKISAVDTCGHESVLSPYHNTIHLEYIGSGQLQWNDYAIEDTITPVSTYNVLIDATGTGAWQLLVSVPGTQNAATDINYNLHPSARYLVQANWAYSCTPERSAISAVFSNFAIRQSTGIINLNTNMVQLYPNPVSNQLTVESVLISGTNIPAIYDITGQLITVDYTLLANKIVFNTSNLADGVYSVKFTLNGQVVTKKFVKVK